MDYLYLISIVVIGLGFFLTYRQGLTDGMRMNRKEDKLPPLFETNLQKKKKLTEKEKRELTIRTNIENYTGSSEGQVKVK